LLYILSVNVLKKNNLKKVKINVDIIQQLAYYITNNSNYAIAKKEKRDEKYI